MFSSSSNFLPFEIHTKLSVDSVVERARQEADSERLLLGELRRSLRERPTSERFTAIAMLHLIEQRQVAPLEAILKSERANVVAAGFDDRAVQIALDSVSLLVSFGFGSISNELRISF